ncbi:hypothetical protein [Lutispora saccharofermentans]|uniref:Lipoprotein n=1 Tax=Lutispora saccharofermentans TaxID=3024236 RepID=A0ABT1NM75_9FIRM|nr:hypothetical protein [Lutispora saccharofermentans]MCQ1531709.1 hypothetical protein [Lutispora saccharofermentans]
MKRKVICLILFTIFLFIACSNTESEENKIINTIKEFEQAEYGFYTLAINFKTYEKRIAPLVHPDSGYLDSQKKKDKFYIYSNGIRTLANYVSMEEVLDADEGKLMELKDKFDKLVKEAGYPSAEIEPLYASNVYTSKDGSSKYVYTKQTVDWGLDMPLEKYKKFILKEEDNLWKINIIIEDVISTDPESKHRKLREKVFTVHEGEKIEFLNNIDIF